MTDLPCDQDPDDTVVDPTVDLDWLRKQTTPVLLRARVRLRHEFPGPEYEPAFAALNEVLAERHVHLDLVDTPS